MPSLMRHVFTAVAVPSIALALFAGCGKTHDDPGPACVPEACAGDELCVDYITDMSTGTQCSATDCDDCECALKEQCPNSTGEATCKEVPNGLRISGCFWSPI
jgi:hypothetical protein